MTVRNADATQYERNVSAIARSMMYTIKCLTEISRSSVLDPKLSK